MTPCRLPLSPALLCPARLTQGALQLAEGGAGQGLMGQRRLQRYLDIGGQNPHTWPGAGPCLADPPGHLGTAPGTPSDAPSAPCPPL